MNTFLKYSLIILASIVCIVAIVLGIYYGVVKPKNLDTTLPTTTSLVVTSVDCKVSDWGSCSKPCGGGIKTRSIIQQPQGSGVPCPSDLTASCNPQDCPVDCKVSDWGSCSNPCGGIKIRSIIQQPQGSGVPCPSDLTASCNTQDCPVDCKVSDWGSCSNPCGGIKIRSIVQQPQGSGVPCPSDLTASCNTQDCLFKIKCRDKYISGGKGYLEVSDYSGDAQKFYYGPNKMLKLKSNGNCIFSDTLLYPWCIGSPDWQWDLINFDKSDPSNVLIKNVKTGNCFIKGNSGIELTSCDPTNTQQHFQMVLA